MSTVEYDAFLKFQATQQSHPDNPVTYAAQGSSVGSWIIDSDALTICVVMDLFSPHSSFSLKTQFRVSIRVLHSNNAPK